MVLQAAGPAEGVVGVAGGAAGAGLGAQGGAERFPAGTDASRWGTQRTEGNQPEPGPQQRSPHQPVPGINQMHTQKCTYSQIHTGVLYSSCQSTIDMQKRDLVLHNGDTQTHYPLEINKQIHLNHYWAIKQNLLGIHCRF